MSNELTNIVIVEMRKFGNFSKNLDAAYEKVRKDTGYRGPFDDIAARDKYFGEFTVSPLRGLRAKGVKIEYCLKGDEKTAPKPKMSGSGPSAERIQYKL